MKTILVTAVGAPPGLNVVRALYESIFIKKVRRITAGKLIGYEGKETSYNPVGYILSADKDREDMEFQIRGKVIRERFDRIKNQLSTRSVRKI